MGLIFAIASLFWQSHDVSVVVCDTPWLDRVKVGQMLDAELAGLTDAERDGLVLVVDQCNGRTVRLRVATETAQRVQIIPIEDVPDEARVRTVVLALAALIDEGEPRGDAAPPVDPQPLPDPPAAAEPTPLPPQRDAPASRPAEDDLASGRHRRLSIGARLRSFLLVRTIAPEGRIGLRLDRWYFDVGGYAWRWSDPLGTVYLAAGTLLVGRALTTRRLSAVEIGLDGLLELGGVWGFGRANEEAEHTPKFNAALGGQFSFWIGFRPGRRFRPTVAVDVGWLRGLNAFAGETHLGGFEGLSVAVGLVGVWSVDPVN